MTFKWKSIHILLQEPDHNDVCFAILNY